MSEAWKDIPNYVGMYQVSNLGRVRSLDRELCDGRSRKSIIMATRNCRGYRGVKLCKDRTVKASLVHRLVGVAFLKNPFEKKTINHINGIRDDNRVENLEWATMSENIKHSYVVLKRKLSPNTLKPGHKNELRWGLPNNSRGLRPQDTNDKKISRRANRS